MILRIYRFSPARLGVTCSKIAVLAVVIREAKKRATLSWTARTIVRSDGDRGSCLNAVSLTSAARLSCLSRSTN